MDKVANRAIRRALQLLSKRVDSRASTDELRSVLRSGTERVAHMDLTKPIWERYGFNSQDELLQSWRARNASAPKKSPVTAPGYNRATTVSADYTPVINAYLGRVSKNYKGRGVLGRFRDLIRRHDVLTYYGLPTIQPYISNKVLGKYKADPSAVNSRLISKLEDRMFRTTGSVQLPDGLSDVFTLGTQSNGISTFPMPVITAFRAQGPFATTGHVMSGPLTRHYNAQVREAVNKLNESGTPVTHRNIKNILADAGVDNTQMTLHSGRTYPDKMVNNYAHVFDADAKPTKDYESVFTAGDPNAPIPEQNYIVEIPDSTIRDRQFEVINRSGMGHILKRPTVSLLNAQGSSDLRLLKGTPFPVNSIIHSTPGDPRIDNILDSTLDSSALRVLRKDKDILHNTDAPNVLNNTIGTKGLKFDVNEDFWYTPRAGSATGYSLKPHGLTISPQEAEGIRLIPVTSAELDALHHVYDVKDIFSKLPSDIFTDLPWLASSYGGVRTSNRLADRMNRNVSQLRSVIKDLAEGKGINSGIGKAITRNSKFRNAGINTEFEYAPDTHMFVEALTP